MFKEKHLPQFNFELDDRILFQKPYSLDVDKYVEFSQENYIESIETLIHHLISDKKKEDRLIVMVGSLVIEKEINKSLTYLNFDKNFIDDLTIHTKIKLIGSLNLIPQEIINILLLLNSVRNKFSHHLEINSFSNSIIEGKIGNLKGYFKFFYPNSENQYDDYEFYIGMLFTTGYTLSLYNRNIQLYGQKIREKKIIKDLEEEYDVNYFM